MTREHNLRALIIIVCVFFLESSLLAQNIQNTSISANSSVSVNATVDPASLGLNISINLTTYPGRAGNNLPVSLAYSSKVWNLDYVDSYYDPSQSWTYTVTQGSFAHESASGWRQSLTPPQFISDNNDAYNEYGNRVDFEKPSVWEYGQSFWRVARFRLRMPDGSIREFRKSDGTYEFIYGSTNNPNLWTGDYQSVDGSRMRYNCAERTLYLADGSRYVHNEYLGFYKFVDTNGNVVRYDGAGASVIDTLGRSVPYVQFPSTGQAQDIAYTLPSFGNTSLNHTFRWKRLQDALTVVEPLRYIGDCALWQTQLSPVLFNGDAQYGDICNGPEIFNPTVLTEIVLPNGTSYKFSYNIYGEIDKIIYPSGGYERFEYQMVNGAVTAPTPYNVTNRGVVKRWVSQDGDPQNELYWAYGNINFSANTFVESPDGIRKENYYHTGYTGTYGFQDPLAGKLLESRTFDQNNNWLSRSLYEYVVGGSGQSGRDPRLVRQISIDFERGASIALGKMLESTHEVPGSGGAPSDPNYFAHLNQKQEKVYGALGISLNTAKTGSRNQIRDLFHSTGQVIALNTTEYMYSAAYLQRGIPSLPVRKKTLNPQNVSDIFSIVEINYDEQGQYYSMIDHGSTDGYEMLTGPYTHLRLNPTTKRTWNRETNSWIELHTQFDNFGNATKAWDTSGDISRYIETEYDAIYKFGYATKYKAPAPDPSGIRGSAVASETSSTFDFVTGLLISATDAKGQTATIEYDSYLRPTRTIPPQGGAAIEKIYNDEVGNTWIKTRKQIDQNYWAETTVYFDRAGRPIKTRTKDPQGDVIVEVKYDSFGRVEGRSNPYREGEQVLWSKPRYDDLGRMIESFAPAPQGQQGASLGTIEFGVSTIPGLVGTYAIATDASGRKARSIYGAYGIARIDEPTGIGGTVDSDLGTLENPHQPTFYTYNIKGELTKITQGNPSIPGQPVQNRYYLYDSLGRVVRVRQPEQSPNPNLATTGNPENNQWTGAYSYDVLGNIVRFTDAKGINIINEYDLSGRPTARCYTKPNIHTVATRCSELSPSEVSTDTSQIDYFYDGKGLPEAPQFALGSLTRVSNSVSESRYTSFDSNGRLLASQQITDGHIYNFSYKYNLAGSLVEQTYPSGRTVSTFLNSDGSLSTISSKTANGPNKTFATGFDYAASGAVRKMMLGNGRWETAQFNQRNQLTQLALGTSPTDKSLWRVDYEYGELSSDGSSVDASRNIGHLGRQTTTIPTTSFVETYRYDAVLRLTEAKETTGGTQNWIQTFGYDKFGNRTNRSQRIGDVDLPINNETLPTVDSASNRFTTGQGYIYDYNGNLIQDAYGRTFVFNAEDKQIEVKDANQNVLGTYLYDGTGARVKKVTNTETTVFVYDAGGTLVAEYSAQQSSTPTTTYLTIDRLGSPRVMTDRSGSVTSRRDFMPFGEEIHAGVGGRTEALKYSLSGVDSVRNRFTGYEKDAETGLDYAQARMYESNHGRFTAVDPLMASVSAHDPQTFNRYIHTGNNPVNRTDPSGLRWVQDANGEIYWIEDDEPLNGRIDVTGQEILLAGGCDAVAGCAYDGALVKFHSDRSISIIANEQGETVVNEVVDVVYEAGELIVSSVEDVVSSITNSFASTPTADVPTIDLPTAEPGGPLEPIGGSDTTPDAGTDTGGGEVDPEVDTGSDWKTTAASILYLLGRACWETSCWESEDDDGDYVYRGLAETDNPEVGLSARNPGATDVQPIQHVAGRRDSPWISTTRDENIARDAWNRDGFGVVRIDLNKVGGEVVDVSNGIPGYEGTQISNWARKNREVLVKGYIPPDAIERLP